MALLGNFIGGALGMQSANDYAVAVDSASKLQALQRKNQIRENLQNNITPSDAEAVTPAPTFNPGDAFTFDNLEQPGLRNIPVPPPKVETKPNVVAPETITNPEITTTPDNQDDYNIGSGGEFDTTPSPSDELTIPNFEPEADSDFDKIGKSGVTDITQVDPESSAFAQDIQKLFADGDFQALFNRLGDRAATGYGDTLAGSPAGRIYGYFTDNPAEALARSKSVAASKWYRTEEARKYFLQNPNQLTAAAVDPTGWYNTFKEEQPKRQEIRKEQKIVTNSAALADKRIASLTDDKTLTGALKSNKVQTVRSAAAAIGFDPNFATAIMGIESSFGASKNLTSTKGAKGIMQVMPGTFDQMRVWYTNPANIAKYNIPDSVVNLAKTMKKGSMTDPTAGLLYLKYGEYIGVPKNLLAAGYQGGMESVLKLGRPTNANDGALTNTDYNRTVISVYNKLIGTEGAGAVSTRVGMGDLSTTDAQIVADASKALDGYEIRQEDGPVVYKDGMAVGRFTGPDGQALAEQFIAEQTGTAQTQTQTVTNADGTEKESIATAEVTDAEQEIVTFLETPPNIGIEMQNLLDSRKLQLEIFQRSTQRINEQIAANNAKAAEYDRFADIALANGQIATFERYSGLADGLIKQSIDLRNGVLESQDAVRLQLDELDNKMLLVQGAQALQDLSFGSTARAGAVLSAFSGLDIQVVKRTDNLYDITIDGQPQGNPLTYEQVVDKLQSTYSAAFRESKQKRAAKRADLVFEKDLDTAAEIAKIEAQMQSTLTTDARKAYLELIKEEAKAAKGQMLSLGEGKALIRTPQGQYIFIDPAGRVADPKSESGFSRGFEKKYISTRDADALILEMEQGSGSGDPYKTK